MTNRLPRLKRILELARNEEKKYAGLVGNAQSRLSMARDRLGELSAHMPNYSRKAQQTDPFSAAHWKDFQKFLYRLDEAVIAQRKVVSECESSLAGHRRRWLSKRQRVKTLENLLDRLHRDALRNGNRIEQSIADDSPRPVPAGFGKF